MVQGRRGLFLIASIVLMTVLAQPACGLSTTPSKSGWSESALQQARELSVSQREKLFAEEGVIKPRPVRISAQRLDPTSDTELWMRETPEDSADGISKIIHFQRHGQGYHNLLGDILREAGITPSVDSTDVATNPWLRPEIVDSPLTEKGKQQCEGQRGVASVLNPELVVVSPLLRAIQTAQISFSDFYETEIPWIAHEGCREETGMLVCNKRRPLSHIKADYPNLNFWEMTEEDSLFDPEKRESSESKSDRIYEFLVDFISKRPESEIAVVGHSAWLFHMCNAVVDCGGDEDLASWFLTSEIRSMRLTFKKE